VEKKILEEKMSALEKERAEWESRHHVLEDKLREAINREERLLQQEKVAETSKPSDSVSQLTGNAKRQDGAIQGHTNDGSAAAGDTDSATRPASKSRETKSVRFRDDVVELLRSENGQKDTRIQELFKQCQSYEQELSRMRVESKQHTGELDREILRAISGESMMTAPAALAAGSSVSKAPLAAANEDKKPPPTAGSAAPANNTPLTIVQLKELEVKRILTTLQNLKNAERRIVQLSALERTKLQRALAELKVLKVRDNIFVVDEGEDDSESDEEFVQTYIVGQKQWF